MRARQCGYHQPKPHEIQRQHDFDRPIDFEELHEAGEPYDRYPPALPTKPHGARADGWGLEEEDDASVSHNQNSVPALDHSEAQIKSSTTADKPPTDDTALSDEPQEEPAGSDSQLGERKTVADNQVQGTEFARPVNHVDEADQGEFPDGQLSPGSVEENAESENGNAGSEVVNTKPEQGNTEPEQGNLGSEEVITNQLPIGDVEQRREELQDVDLTSQIEEEAEEVGTGLAKPDLDRDTSAQFDSGPESDSDPNTLTEEAEGLAEGNGESMPILT